MALSQDHKPPAYTPREMEAIIHADRVVVRILTPYGWKEEEFFPSLGQTLAQRLGEVQMALDMVEDRDARVRRAVVYVGGVVRGERMIAAVRRGRKRK